MSTSDITGDQFRAARSLVRLEQRELAQRIGISQNTLKSIERAEGVPRSRTPTLQVLRTALEEAGVEFIQGGVRFRDTAQSK